MAIFNLNKIKVISFDAFNTLLNDKNSHPIACQLILDHFNKKDINVDEFHKEWDSLINDGWRNLNNKDQKFLTQKIFFLKATKKLFNKYKLQGDPSYALKIWFDLLNDIELFAEVPETLDKIKNKGYKIVISSNIDNDFLYDKLKKFNIQNKFDHIFTSENLQAYKPNKIFFNKILDNLNINHNEIIHVGDSQFADIFGAKNSGIYAVYINRKNRKIKENIPSPDLEINNLHELLNYL
ncbi:MAG: HAD family hydrolase [Candidatus Helarchaeota archaeon]